MTKADESICVINVDNDESGVQFVFRANEEAKAQSFDVDEGDEQGSLEITPEFDGEFSVVFPEDAWVVLVNGRLTVKFTQYNSKSANFTVFPYDKY